MQMEKFDYLYWVRGEEMQHKIGILKFRQYYRFYYQHKQ